MILNGFLEDLLQRAGTTWHVDESSIGFGEDGIFTDAVVEELGNMRGKDCRRFVSVVPCGDGKTLVIALWILADYVKSR